MNRFCFSKRRGRALSWMSVIVLALIIIALQPSLCDTYKAYSQTDLADTLIWNKRDTKEAILFIGRINADLIADTVIGRRSRNFQHVPDRIVWGGISRGRRFTQIRYPKWRQMSGSLSIMDVNLDTIPDMVIHVQGKIRDSSGSTVNYRDTSRIIAIFGQAGLDTLQRLDIGDIALGFQSTPFFAVDLFAEQVLTEPGVRDLSGTESYILVPLESSQPHDSSRTIDISTTPPAFTAFPNPTAQSISLKLTNVPTGIYQIRVLAVNGAIYQEQSVELAEPGEIDRTLQLHNTPTGYYVIQVFSQLKLIATYPFVVVH